MVTAVVACSGGLVLLCLVPGTRRNRLASLLPRPRRPVSWSVDWRALATRAGEGARRRAAVVVLCRVLAAELRAGQPPEEALRRVSAPAVCGAPVVFSWRWAVPVRPRPAGKARVGVAVTEPATPAEVNVKVPVAPVRPT